MTYYNIFILYTAVLHLMYLSVVLCNHFMCCSFSGISEYTAVAIFRVSGRRMDGWRDGWIDGWMDGWRDG